MTLGIVACSAKKMPTPCPAWLLYSASPTFSQSYLAAKQDCDTVRILSGKHGLIEPERVIAPYDQRINPDRPGLAEEIQRVIHRIGDPDVLSYCPKDYGRALRLVKHRMAATGGIYEKAQALGRRGSVKGNVFPLRASLLWLHQNHGAKLKDFQRFCMRTWATPSTQRAQYNRLLRSPFCIIKDGRVFYAFTN